MNPFSWGSNAWDFLHQLPWLYPKEVLTKTDSVEVIKFMHSVLRILSCSACSESALDFEKRLGIINAITVFIKSRGYRAVTRAKLAQYIYDLHNEVNKKLEKPIFGTNWRDSLKDRKKWGKHMFSFLFSVVWNYPKQNPPIEKKILYEYFFTITLPSVIKYTDVGKFYASYLYSQDFSKTLDDRDKMFRWIYELKISLSHICGPTWEYSDVCTFMQAMEARSNCHGSKGCQ